MTTPREPSHPPLTLRKADMLHELRCSARHFEQMRASAKLPKPVRIGEGARSDRWLRTEVHEWCRAGCPDLATWEAMKTAAQPIGVAIARVVEGFREAIP